MTARPLLELVARLLAKHRLVAVQQVPMVMALLEAGFADNLLFASDFSSATQLKRANKDMGYAKTLTVFVPKLKAAGASDAVLHGIMVDNPRRFLAFVPKIARKG